MGNVDPAGTLCFGSQEDVRRETERLLALGERPPHRIPRGACRSRNERRLCGALRRGYGLFKREEQKIQSSALFSLHPSDGDADRCFLYIL